MDLGLLSTPQTSQLPPGDRRDDRQGQGLLGRRHGPDLPEPGRSRPGRRRLHAGRRGRRGRDGRADQGRVPRPHRPERLDPRRPARGLEGDRPGLHQGRGPVHPQRPGHHGRHGPPDAHRRPRRLLLPALPVRRRDAGHAGRALAVLRPARLRAGRPGPRRTTSTCGRPSSPAARASPRARSTASTIDLAPTLAYMLGIPEPQHSQGRVLLEVVKGGVELKPISIIGLNDFHGQLEPDDARRSTAQTIAGRRRGRPGDAVRRGVRRACPARADPRRRRQRRRLAAELGACSRTCRPSTPRTPGAWTPPRTATTSSTTGSTRLLAHQARANFPFLATNIVETATGQTPPWVTPSVVFTVNGIKVGVIGAELENTPELVSAGDHRRADVPARGRPDQGRVGAAAQAGRQGPGRGHPPGHEHRVEHRRQRPPARRGSGRSSTSPTKLQDTTVDAMVAGHTHRVSNLMVGKILVTEGINAGASYSVLQLMVRGGDVEWAGGATRVAKTIGVAPARRRQGDRRRRQRPDARSCATRSSGRRPTTSLRDPDRDSRVGDGQHGRRRDARRSTRASRRPRPTPAACGPTSCAHRRRPASSPARSPGARCSPCCPSATATVIETLTGAQMKDGVHQRLHAVCDPAFAGGTGRFPQVSGLKVAVPLQPARRRRSSTGSGRRPTGPSGTLTPIGAGRHRPVRHQRLHVHRWRRLHRLHPGHERPAAGRRCCWTWSSSYVADRTRHRPARRGTDRRPVAISRRPWTTRGPGRAARPLAFVGRRSIGA